jgi:hypothetical protein
MMTPIVHDLLRVYTTTLGALLDADRDDAFLREYLGREFLGAHADLYGHLWEFAGGRIDAGRLTVVADSEGAVSVRIRGHRRVARRFVPSVN